MTPAQALHTFARRYCIERSHKWTSVYAELSAAGKDRRGADYTAEAYNIFPRCNVLLAILLDVETLDFDRLPELQELGSLLTVAGETASSEFTGKLTSPTARNAEQEERELFVRAVDDAARNVSMDVHPLHYRRTLSSPEVKEIWRKVRAIWGMKEGYWYPLDAKSHSSLLAFQLSEIDEPALQKRIKAFLKAHGIHRIFELREFGRENYYLDAGVDELFYGSGGEGYWTSEQGDWIVYCSHEGTITLGGTILEIAPPNSIGDDQV